MAIGISGAASGISGAVQSIFSGFASEAKADMFRTSARLDLLKGEGSRIEGENYLRAAELARLNKTFTEASTAIQLAQSDRAVTLALGGIKQGVAAAGLKLEGSAEDVLRASEHQAAIEHQVLAEQGLIQAEGYQEQADTYENMKKAADIAVEGSKLASEMHLRAADAEDDAATGHYFGAALKGVGAIASLFGV